MKPEKLNKRMEKAQARNVERMEKTGEQIAELAQAENIVNTLAKSVCTLVLTVGADHEVTSNAIYALACAIVHARIKRINNVSKNGADNHFSLQNVALKNDVSRMFDRNGKGTKYAVALSELESLYVTRTIKTGSRAGETETVCTDKRLASEICKRLEELTADGDGMDIVHDVVAVIWERIASALADGTLSEDTLLQSREKLLKRSCFYRNGEQKPREMWQYTTTNTVKDCSLVVSQHINHLSERQTYETAFTELQYTATDKNGEEIEIIRYSPVAEIALSGSGETLTVNNAVVGLIESVAERANFTARQAFIFKNVICGSMELVQVADKFGISKQAVYKQFAETRRKCYEALTDEQKEIVFRVYGYDVTATADRTSEKKSVLVLDETGAEVGRFPSVSACALALNVSRCSVQNVLSGFRKAVKGYTIRYI